jgi:hypothetical protein
LLKLSFPFDAKTLEVRPVTSVKFASSSGSTSVTSSFEHADPSKPSDPVSKIDIATKIRDAEVKGSFSTKDKTAGVTVSVSNKLVQGSKVVLEVKSKKGAPHVGATIDFASPKVALRLKGELPFDSKKEWDASVALNGSLEKFSVGGQVKYEKKSFSEAGLTASVSPSVGTLNFGAVLEAPGKDGEQKGGYALTFSSFHRFHEASNGRAATFFKFPFDSFPIQVKAAALYNPNNDTTLGFYFDHTFSLAASLQVKVSDRFSFNASVHSAFADLISDKPAPRVVGLGFEVNV